MFGYSHFYEAFTDDFRRGVECAIGEVTTKWGEIGELQMMSAMISCISLKSLENKNDIGSNK